MSDSNQVRIYFTLTEEEAKKLQTAIDDGELKQFGIVSFERAGPPQEISMDEWQRRINTNPQGRSGPQ